ncbi:MAG: hypothetical protein HPY30_00915 [Gammaproteobacteria bacterium (ex Lamellibrachia satsuma)]|nr:MAG: hypothetical protein HPY30_00915 [Gammaproteobacteria bacterium (ex Lamellibrachia satsuma)]
MSTFVLRFIIAVPLARLLSGYLVDAIYWIFWNLIGVNAIPWDKRFDTALHWVCGFIALARLIREFPRLPRIALAALIAYLATPHLLDGLLWTFDAQMPPPGLWRTYLYGFFGLFTYAVAKSWLRWIPPLTF